jgi:hypothetical protein
VLTLSNQLVFHSALAAPAPESDYMTNLRCCETVPAVEALAEPSGSSRSVRSLTRVSYGAIGFGHLVQQLRSIAAADESSSWPAAFRLAGTSPGSTRSATRWRLTSTTFAAPRGPPADLAGGTLKAEAFVLADDGAHDELVTLFHRLWRAH